MKCDDHRSRPRVSQGREGFLIGGSGGLGPVRYGQEEGEEEEEDLLGERGDFAEIGFLIDGGRTGGLRVEGGGGRNRVGVGRRVAGKGTDKLRNRSKCPLFYFHHSPPHSYFRGLPFFPASVARKW